MEGFIKTSKPELTGFEKAAILMAEVGPLFNSNYDALFEKLQLTTNEIKKIRKAIKKLGYYAPARASYENGMEQIAREQSVLKEALSFGASRGITKKAETAAGIQKQQPVKQLMPDKIKNMASQNPDDLAKVIQTWLGE